MIFTRESKNRFLVLTLLACIYSSGSTGSSSTSINVFAFSPSISTSLPSFTKTTTELFSSTSTPTSPSPATLAANAPKEEGPSSIGYTSTCFLPPSEINPIFTLKKGEPKEKIVNPFGIYTIIIAIVLNPIWALAMFVTDAVCNAFPDLDPNRAFYDYTGKVWSRAWLTIADSYPTISGDVERLNKENDLGACLFVANHASWLDIPVLCTVLDPVFKFIAKGELKSIPCIGQQLVGGKHIMIDREDRRSQLRTFKEGVAYLTNGVPLMAFPEGKRSSDGRLAEFKGGIFSMAVKAKVPIVPISISNTHAIMPSNALFPFQKGKGKLHVHVHEPIYLEGKNEKELAELVKNKLLSRMPLEQHPLVVEEEGGDGSGSVSGSGSDSKGSEQGEAPKELQSV